MPETPDWAASQFSGAYQSTTLDLVISESASGTSTAIGAVAGQSIVLVGLRIGPAYGATSVQALRGLVWGFAQDPVGSTHLADVAISPALPTYEAVVPYGAGICTVGRAVGVTFYSAPGLGSQEILCTLTYYYQTG